MPYKNIIWIKLEKRLLNDYRFYILSEPAQLIYIKLLMLAAETDNKIPRSEVILRGCLRTTLNESEISNCLNEIKSSFPKFRSNKHHYYFSEWEYKHNRIENQELLGNSQGTPRDAVDKIRKEKIRKDKIGRFTPPTLEEVKSYCLERNNGVDYDKWFNFYSAKGWLIGKNKMKDWKAAVRTWEIKKEKVYTDKEAPKAPEISEEQRKQNLKKMEEVREGLIKKMKV